MKNYKFLLVLLFSMLSQLSFSADTLRVEIIGNDTFAVTEGGTFDLTLRLHNDSTHIFGGTIGFAYTIQHPIDTVTYTDTSTINGGFLFLVETLNIVGNTFVDKNLTGYVNQPRFKTGPTVVIIWPIVTNNNVAVQVGNKVSILVQVDTTTGIAESAPEKLHIFKWGNELVIQHQPLTSINHLQIFDISGKEVLNKPNPADNTPLPPFNTGIYIAEITFNNNQRQVFRFYK